MKKPKEDNRPTEFSIWDRVGEDNPVMLSEFDLQAFLLKEDRREADNLFEFLRRKFETSNIPKTEVRIYAMQMECVISWFNMGFKEIANEELFEVLTELSINNSVGGFTKILATADVGANVVMQPGQPASVRIGQDQQYDEQKQGTVSKIRNKILGG